MNFQSLRTLHGEKIVKRGTNFSLSVRTLYMPREMGMDVSQTADSLLIDQVRQQYWACWNIDYKNTVAICKVRVVVQGVRLVTYRGFMQSI